MYGSSCNDEDLRRAQQDARYYKELYEQECKAEAARYAEEQRRRESREQEYEEARRQASSWPEAFRKQRSLYQQEIKEFADFKARYPEEAASMGIGFEEWIVGNNRAEELYREMEPKLQEQIKALRTAMHQQLIEKLRAEFPQGHADLVIASLEDDDPGGYLYW